MKLVLIGILVAVLMSLQVAAATPDKNASEDVLAFKSEAGCD